MTAPQDLKALYGFLDETADSLENIESAFLQLEEDPSNQEIIARIFRPVHSLKGNSGFFGLTNVNNFAHRLENLLDFIRSGQLTVCKEIIDVLLAGVDYLRKMLARIAEDPEEVVLRPEEEEFLRERVDTLAPEKAEGSFQSAVELQELLAQFQELGLSARHKSQLRTILDQTARANRDLRQLLNEEQAAAACSYAAGASYHFQGRDLTGSFQAFGQVLVCLDQKQAASAVLVQDLNQSLQELMVVFEEEAELAEAFEELLSLANFLDDPLMATSVDFGASVRSHFNAILSRCECSGQAPAENHAPAGQEGQSASGAAEQSPGSAPSRPPSVQERKAGKSIRIDQNKLDQFADSVGELYIKVDAFNFLRRQLEQEAVKGELLTRFANTVATLDESISKLQENIMEIRKVSVEKLLQRLPRVVRNLADSLGKKVNLEIQGAETVIDKDLLEKLENPLVHLLRNALDHGLEDPASRTAGGKSEEGNLLLRAAADDNNVILEIRDDGRGIDPEKIRKTAVAKGFLTAEEAAKLTSREALHLIFQSGLSSTDKISDVSGRGVGMDVVHAAVKECRGSIDLVSECGRGTTVTLKVPLTKTLVTKEALIVKCADQLFAMPSEEIECAVYPEGYLSLLGANKGYAHNGAVYNVINLAAFFQLGQSETTDQEKMLLIWKRERTAFLVDGLASHQYIVVKTLPERYRQFRDIPGINGFTILGNEEIVLIIDPARVASEADRPAQNFDPEESGGRFPASFADQFPGVH